MAKNTDLHTHSYYSDGQISPKELVRLAKKRGIKYLALTDHNSTGGIKEATIEGKKIGINVIPSVEVEVDTGEVLGYFIDSNNRGLKKILEQNRLKSNEKIKDWCKKLNKAGYDISFEEIKKKFPKAKNNINSFYPLFLMYLKGYGKPLNLSPKLKKDNRLKVMKIKKPSVIKVIRIIKNSGGVPVLAHPWIDDMEYNFKNIKYLVKAGLKGIEFNNGDRAPLKSKKAVKKIKELAKKYDLILTSGSDFHGNVMVKLMPGNHNLGKNNCDEKVVNELRRLAKNW